MAPPADYTWHIFLSFRRWQEWPYWVKRHFDPLFRHYLGEELGVEPRVFVDWQDRRPGDWPTELGVELARSRVLVPLLSRMYFESPWCTTEYELMRLREERCKRALIVPAIIHDGRDLPDHARRAYSAELVRYANPRMTRESPRGEKLADRIADWVPTVAQAIRKAPPHDPDWEADHVQAMDRTFVMSKQRSVPSWAP
jgi:hypothetical protein